MEMDDRLRRMVELPHSEFLDAMRELGLEEMRQVLLLMAHRRDQSEGRVEDTAMRVEMLHVADQLLRDKGLGSPGFETVGDVWHLLTPEERLVVARVLELTDDEETDA